MLCSALKLKCMTFLRYKMIKLYQKRLKGMTYILEGISQSIIQFYFYSVLMVTEMNLFI